MKPKIEFSQTDKFQFARIITLRFDFILSKFFSLSYSMKQEKISFFIHIFPLELIIRIIKLYFIVLIFDITFQIKYCFFKNKSPF